MNGLTPSYLHERVPENPAVNMALRRRNINTPSCRTERYANSFFPYCIKHRNELDNSIKTLPSVSSFKTHINNYVRPKGNSYFGINEKFGIKL